MFSTKHMRVGIGVGVFVAVCTFSVAPTFGQQNAIVISEFRTRGPNGGNDEFVEIYNRSLSPVPIGNWTLRGSNSSGTTGIRATVPGGTMLNPGCHYLFTNSDAAGYSGSVPGNTTYTTGITDTGGIAIADQTAALVDQVGMNNGSAYKEGTVLAAMAGSANQSYERKPGGASGSGTDTNNNANDFVLNASSSDPQNLASSCGAGFGLSTTRIDTTASGAGATPDGNIDSDEYGLGNSYSYAGGGSGFGGTLGGGTIYMNSDSTHLFIGFKPLSGSNLGSGNGNVVAILLDTKSGGFIDSAMGDPNGGDGSRQAVSNLARQADDLFYSTFLPDYGIAISTFGVFTFELTGPSGTSLTFVGSTQHFGTGLGDNSRETKIPLSALGMTAGGNVDFIAGYVSNDSGSGSNESIPPFAALNSYPNIGTGTFSFGYGQFNRFTTFACTPPVAPTTASATPQSYCSGAAGDITLDVTGGSGDVVRWYRDGCGVAGSGTLVGSGSPTSLTIPKPANTTTYHAYWENSCGISTCASVTVTVNPLPANPTNPVASNPSICVGGSSVLSVDPVPGGVEVHWTTSSTCAAGFDVGVANGQTVNPAVTTDYYAYTVVTATGCKGTGCVGPVTVTVNPDPTVSLAITGGGTPSCSGEEVMFTATAAGGNPPLTYAWDFGDSCAGPWTPIPSETGPTLSVNPTATTAYRVTVSSTGSGCGSASDCILITVPNCDDGDPCTADSCTGGVCSNDPIDTDNDTIPDCVDNCPAISNTNQDDFDGDNIGDACDPDDDNDGVPDGGDLCPETPIGEPVNAQGCACSQITCNPTGTFDCTAGTCNCLPGYSGQFCEIPPPATGACCDAGFCTNGLTQAACEGFGGTFMGGGSTCTSSSCPCPPGYTRCGPSCQAPDNGIGTIDFPAGCALHSPDDQWMIVDGLPPGTTVQIDNTMFDIGCTGGGAVCSFPQDGDCAESGGSLGGEKSCRVGTFHMPMQGTGTLVGFNRIIAVPFSMEVHSAPRTPGNPVQSFDTDMFRLFGQITGDPDFDLLRVTGGTDFGLPSPGHTTLTQRPGGTWAVDSFFDITYRIDFVGRPGGALSGMSGSTTATIRMGTGGGCVDLNNDPLNCGACGNVCQNGGTCSGGSCVCPPGYGGPNCEILLLGACCDVDGACSVVPQAACAYGIFRGIGTPCPAACPFPPVTDSYCSSAIVNFLVGTEPQQATFNLPATGLTDTVVRRTPPPYTDGEPIPTEMIQLDLVGTVTSGTQTGQSIEIHLRTDVRSFGRLDNVDADMGGLLTADSFFDIFIQIEMPGLSLNGNTGAMPIPITAPGINNLPPWGSTYGSGPINVPVNPPSSGGPVTITGVTQQICPSPKCVYEVTCVDAPDAFGCAGVPPCGAIFSGAFCPNGTCPGTMYRKFGATDCCVMLTFVGCMQTNAPPFPDGGPCSGPCLPKGSCTNMCTGVCVRVSAAECTTLGGVYGGDCSFCPITPLPPVVCDDGNPCTDNICDPLTGMCSYPFSAAGTPCTDDGNPCTEDVCDGNGNCLHNPLPDGTPCDGPADECIDHYVCIGGVCTPVFKIAGSPCTDDGNPCTDDVCDGAGNCTHPNKPDGTICDGPPNECVDHYECQGGMCVPIYKSFGSPCADDGNPCTNDICDGNGNCIHPNKPDGTLCTGPVNPCVDHYECVGGSCVPVYKTSGTPCADDGNPCTDDFCDGAGNCIHPPKAAGTPCPDDGNPCTDDVCDGFGGCAHPPKAAGTPCPDDGNPCTDDICDGAGGCLHPPKAAGTACPDDGDPCTNDLCDGAGGCIHPLIDCDDGNPCTIDSCVLGVCQNDPDPACGACCAPDATCSITQPAGCIAPSIFQGAGTVCTPNPCTVTGACCVGSTCSITTQAACTGSWNGAGSLCPTLHILLELSPTMPASVTRCITFELYNGPTLVSTFERPITFASGSATYDLPNVDVPLPCGTYTCMTARDKLHTVTSTVLLSVTSGNQYTADFTGKRNDEPGGGVGGHRLVGGNLNGDPFIDVLDFGAWAGQYLLQYANGNTGCSTPSIHADISGNGDVDSDDFSFIAINFLIASEPECNASPVMVPPLNAAGGRGPVHSITTAELRRVGLGHLTAGDVNKDGVINTSDVAAVFMGQMPQTGGAGGPKPPKRISSEALSPEVKTSNPVQPGSIPPP